MSVLRADAGVVQTGRDGVDGRDLAVFVLAEVGLHAVEDAQTAGRHGRSGLRRIDAASGGLTADQPNAFILDEVIECADGVRTAAYAREHCVRQTAFLLQQLLLDFLGNDRPGSHGRWSGTDADPCTEPRQ